MVKTKKYRKKQEVKFDKLFEINVLRFITIFSSGILLYAFEPVGKAILNLILIYGMCFLLCFICFGKIESYYEEVK